MAGGIEIEISSAASTTGNVKDVNVLLTIYVVAIVVVIMVLILSDNLRKRENTSRNMTTMTNMGLVVGYL